MLSHFHLIPERHGRTDRQTDRIAISISHVNVLTRDKNKAKESAQVLLMVCVSGLHFTSQCWSDITKEIVKFLYNCIFVSDCFAIINEYPRPLR